MKKNSDASSLEMFIALGFAFGLLYLVSLWTDRSLEFWLSYSKGSPVEVPQWLSFILTIVLNGVILLANIVSEIIRLAI